MKILLTNDDGYKAKGILALAKIFQKHHDVTMVAPRVEHSGMSHSITIRKPLEVRRETIEGLDIPVYSVQGTPADCVRVGLDYILDHSVDLVVSGCNLGYNAGMDILYSGTVSACAEANLFRKPALAISAQMYKKFDADFDTAADIAYKIFEKTKDELVKDVLTLNVNIPYAMGSPKKPVVCLVGEAMLDKYEKKQLGQDAFDLKLIGRNRGRYKEDTDRYYLDKGHTTISPIRYQFANQALHSHWKEIWES